MIHDRLSKPLWASVCIVTHLLAMIADYVHLFLEVHRLNLTYFSLWGSLFLAVSRFVTFISTTVANVGLFVVSTIAEKLRLMNSPICPIQLLREISQSN